VGVANRGTQPVYFVRDNGAGFEMTHAERLFTPFGRLHSEREYAGTGIGLATVRRIVERHGGEVWAEGAVGEGALIAFTVPTTDLPDSPAAASRPNG
jgi:light-regulated signal transduction histidine kinase (bacteriophytochrome)